MSLIEPPTLPRLAAHTPSPASPSAHAERRIALLPRLERLQPPQAPVLRLLINTRVRPRRSLHPSLIYDPLPAPLAAPPIQLRNLQQLPARQPQPTASLRNIQG